MVYRALGTFDTGGNFVPPLSYYEAQYIASRKLFVFLQLDSLIAKIAKQRSGKK